MSICKIYAVYPDTGRKYETGSVLKHYDMNNWLLDKGKKNLRMNYMKEKKFIPYEYGMKRKRHGEEQQPHQIRKYR
jgi:hypothetical protein